MINSETTESQIDLTISKPKRWIGIRHLQFLLLWSCIVICYGMRSNLSVAIVAITSSNETDSNSNAPTYPEWSDKKQLMHSSFFWGYICLPIFAGQLAERFGPKYFLCGAIVVSSIFSILLPIFGMEFGYIGVIVCRIVQGLFQGFLYPSTHNMLANWTPASERAKVATFVYSGGPLGTVISNLVTGLICDSPPGWPVAFYLYGGVGVIWCCVWFIFGSNAPTEHKTISENEKKYIKANVNIGEKKSSSAARKTPWKAIFTSVPFWALFLTNSGQNWGFWTLLEEIPTYLNKRLGYNMSNNSLMSSLPYLALWILSFFVSPVADYLILRNYLSVGACRKLFNSIGMFVPAAALIYLGFLDENQKTLAVTLLIVAVSVNAGIFCGYGVNHIDLAPNFSGTLLGITNGIGTIVSIVAPLAIAAIESSTGLQEEDGELWKIVFCLAAAVYIFVGSIFLFFASGELQYWNGNYNIMSCNASFK